MSRFNSWVAGAMVSFLPKETLEKRIDKWTNDEEKFNYAVNKLNIFNTCRLG